MSNIIDVETQNNLQYVFFPVSSSTLRFKVKAANDAHVALTRGNYENDPMTELHIGGWDNTKSIVRRNRREPDKVKVETPRILNRNEYVGMWIRWHNGCIAAGLEGSSTPFMSYNDPSPHPIDHAAVRTGWGSTGSWKIEVSPVIVRPIAPKPVGGDLHWVAMTSGDKLPPEAVIGGYENGEVVYVARAMHNNSMRPGKYVHSMKHAYLCWGHVVHKKKVFEVLCGNNLMWVDMKGDLLPPHAFPGGTDFERNNEDLYIGRAKVNNNLIPGKIHLHYKTCYMPHSDPECEKEAQQFEVLVIPDRMPQLLTWHAPTRRRRDSDFVSLVLPTPIVPKPLGTDGELHWVRMTSGDQLPPDAVIGGFDKGETVYVARARHNIGLVIGLCLVPGKYVPSLKRAVIGWGLQAYNKESFEILCGYNLSWIKAQGAAIPPNAFPSGLAPETNNEVLYIGRAKVENSLIPGKVHLSYNTCYITYEHLEKERYEYEALVVPDRKDLRFLKPNDDDQIQI